MNLYEEELQKNIEAGRKPTGDDPDLQAYHEVFIRLDREPEFQLSSSFPDQIVSRLLERKQQSSYRDFFWLGIGIVLLAVSCIVAAVMSGLKLNLTFLSVLNLGLLKDISEYAGLFAFGAAFIIILNLLEKKFISQKTNDIP